MYVAALDRPWTDTPFMFQGFVLETEEQLETLKKFCKSVFVDEARSELRDLAPLKPFTPRYNVQVPVEGEVEKAKAAHRSTHAAVREMLHSVRVNRALDTSSIEQAVTSMTESVLRNPDALLLFSRLREKGDYLQSHALDTAVYVTSFGRFLELSVEQISLLGYVGLMQDVGKLRVPDEILKKRERLTVPQMAEARRHVQHSVDILPEPGGLRPEVAGLAAWHHERRDGSGYPKGLKGAEIGMIGCIAAIADVFDALTGERPMPMPYRPPRRSACCTS